MTDSKRHSIADDLAQLREGIKERVPSGWTPHYLAMVDRIEEQLEALWHWPLDEDQDEFERITHDMRQEQHDERMTRMNVTLRTWRVGRLRIDRRPRWTFAVWRRPRVVFFGPISVEWLPF